MQEDVGPSTQVEEVAAAAHAALPEWQLPRVWGSLLEAEPH